jgi:hypothetical protein
MKMWKKSVPVGFQRAFSTKLLNRKNLVIRVKHFLMHWKKFNFRIQISDMPWSLSDKHRDYRIISYSLPPSFQKSLTVFSCVWSKFCVTSKKQIESSEGFQCCKFSLTFTVPKAVTLIRSLSCVARPYGNSTPNKQVTSSIQNCCIFVCCIWPDQHNWKDALQKSEQA